MIRAAARFSPLVLALLLAACAATATRAPVVDRLPEAVQQSASAAKVAAKNEAKDGDWRPAFYTVKKGDTLYSIALEYGFDYKELAAWNGLDNPGRILVDQQLRFTPPPEVAVVTPMQITAPVEGRPVAEPAEIKTQPKALKLPYSEQALAQLRNEAAAPAETAPAAAPAKTAKQENKPQPDAAGEVATEQAEHIEWSWPASGKVQARFSDNPNLKGIDIAGTQGQPVLASAAGKVVYSGSGIRGYGKLIVIKHSPNYSSVYTHNSEILVKEGQLVGKGQKIAEMGNTDTDRVKLHFEIRRLGKPVDPEKYLPGGAS